MIRTLVVFNPKARGGAAAKIFPDVQAALRGAGVEFDTAFTQRALHAVDIAAHALQNGYERIIAVGGDGIVHEVLNGLMRASHEDETITLGIIPLGKGNDFIKALPPPLNPSQERSHWQPAVARIAEGKTILVDVGRITGDNPVPGQPHPHYFANAMDVGFGAMVARAVQNVPKTLPPTAFYMLGIVQVMLNYKLPRIKLTLDDSPPRELRTTMTVVSNGRCLGSSFWLTPNADVCDGYFDVLMADALGRGPILALIPRLMNGTHIGHPALRFTRARRVLVEIAEPVVVEADGELPFLQTRRLDIENLPRRLRVIV